MIFASSIFLYWFLPAFLLLYYASPKGLKSVTVALCSYVFYGWWRPDFLILMWISTVLDFFAGRQIERGREAGRPGKGWLLLSVIVNLGLLGYFKYANFGVDTANTLLASLGFEQIAWTKVILPVGISFYTFQTMSYTIDVYRGTAPKVKSFGDFMCYVAMFPQLVAGPIVRYHDLAEQLRERTHSLSRFYQGVVLFQCGLAKKVLIADLLNPVSVAAFEQGNALSTGDAWIGLAAYTFQIYFDFSGYSDMAIGLGLMIGFRFPLNFSSPYKSQSITEFWRRWHISLSTWLRDYLYLPLGGNRRGARRTYINLATVMLFGGLWHGANWTFLAWGAYQGVWLIVERLSGKRSFYGGTPAAVRVLITFVITMGGWVFFRAVDIGAAGDYFAWLVGGGGEGAVPIILTRLQVLALGVAVLIAFGLPASQALSARDRLWWVIVVQVLFLIAIMQLHYQSHVPFLYYQF
ncbi:MAG: membrane-bound O-acyltransferase family protein [Planctomycetes bacterium]|nr:membrane-bound O-acyltransferase family protein [Planctomycetota bacterium]